jgi:hypothetical protein
MSEPNSPSTWGRLSDLPMAAKLAVACFLVSVGVGYFSALIQLHFQHASPGSLMPTMKNVVEKFHGHVGAEPKCRLERLLLANENQPFNGNGQMKAAFTTRSSDPGWTKAVKARAEKLAAQRVAVEPPKADQQALDRAEEELRTERKGEVDTIIGWINAGHPEEAYTTDEFHLPEDFKDHKITEKFRLKDGPGGKLKSILDTRCARCHNKAAPDDANAGNFPLESYEDYKKYLKVEKATAMSVEKLAQTTHVHLLSFSMLYFLTGVLFAMTRYPNLIKIPLAVTPLVFQLLDISCWWLARLEGDTGVWFAQMIPFTGGVVGLGLGLQILLTLFDVFKTRGRLVLVFLLVAGGFGATVVAYKVIAPHMAAERAAAAAEKK